MRRAVPICLIGLGLAALAARPAACEEHLQPSDSRDGLVLRVEDRLASAHTADGRVQRTRLRPAERLLSVHELESGWIAAGIRLLDGGAELLLVEQSGAGLRRLGVPAAPGAGGPLLRTRPVVLSSDGRMVGLAWLEGTPGEPLGVRAARRAEEGGWEAPAPVSPAGRRSQTGLVGAVLPDGRWLLAWSRFDGTDDELVWSLGDLTGWSSPRAVHEPNDAADVTPTLFAGPDAVLLAWSRMVDAEYRVLTARWNGAGFEGARPVTGPGSLYPSFAGLDGDPYLIVRRARAPGWGLLDVDRGGAVLRRAEVASGEGGRPALVGSSGNQAQILLASDATPRQATWEAVDR
jgi:hypothetical protein